MLSGKRIRLRAIEEADLPLMAAWRSEPEVYPYFQEYEPLSLRNQRAWYESQLGKNEKNFIISTHDGQAIGTVGIYNIDARNRHAEWGRLLIGVPEFRAAGLGAEAEILILEYGFGHLNLNKLYCTVLATNDAVLRQHLRLGYTQEGTLREHVFKQGRYIDVHIVSVLASEYEKHKKHGQMAKLIKALSGKSAAEEEVLNA